MSLCLAGAGAVTKLSLVAFTLAWTHTIEKTAWEEDWRVANGFLVISEARVHGSGAGMEPPPDAVFSNGLYRWRPVIEPQRSLTLRRAPEAGDWRLCVKGICKPFSDFVPEKADPVVLYPCS